MSADSVPTQSRTRGLAVAGLALLLLLGVFYVNTFTFGVHDHTILARSLIADIALPVLLIAHIPAFFGPNRAQRHDGRSPVTA
jgi:hypothetical protein